MDFFQEQEYLKAKQKFDTGKIWEKLVTDYNNFTSEQMQQFYEQFEKLENYGDKLRFWKENRLSPIKLQYTFKLTIENHPKQKNVVLSLHPFSNEDKKQYLKWLIKQCYENYISDTTYDIEYNFETVSLEELKQGFQQLKGDFIKNIEREISNTKQRIKSKRVDEDVYSYLTYRKREPNIFSDLKIDGKDVVVSLQYFAIQVAFVYDFLEYILFLENCRISNRVPVLNMKLIPFVDKSFKAKENIDLKDLYDFLVVNKYIEDTGCDKFEKVFSEVLIKEEIKKEDKINWISCTRKNPNWQGLFVLIYFCCGEEIFNNNANADIEKKLDKCFTAPDNGFVRMDSFSRAGSNLIEKKFSIKLENVKNLYYYFN